jgi:miniconductance mechanosensitive channel
LKHGDKNSHNYRFRRLESRNKIILFGIILYYSWVILYIFASWKYPDIITYMESKILLALRDFLLNLGVSSHYVELTTYVVTIFFIASAAWIADWITKRIILGIIKALAAKSKTIWDDILVEKRFFHRLAHFIPIFIVYHMAGEALKGYAGTLHFIQLITYSYAIFIGMRVIDAFLNSIIEIYNTLPNAKNRSIKGYIQVGKIIVYFIGSLVILSVLLDKDLMLLLGGLGAMTAVLLLIFKDTIMGLVGGIQLAANDIIRIGDWIEMPSRLADGTVIDISLNTVKIQNADMTITTIPTYALVNESFYNWRGIDEAGGRRIKRSILIDMKSIHFVDEAQLKKFRSVKQLEEHILRLESEKQILDISTGVTNIGLFRRYLELYLKEHPKIKPDMTLVVRQRQPTENGLPIEIYVFTRERSFKQYEEVQSEIFDHILAILPEFRLHVFQNPTGEDFKVIRN